MATDPRTIEFLKRAGYKFPEVPAVSAMNLIPKNQPLTMDQFVPTTPPAAEVEATPPVDNTIPPVPQRPPLGWGDALGQALAGYGDAMLARTGRPGSALKSTIAAKQISDQQSMEDQQRGIDRQQKTVEKQQADRRNKAVARMANSVTGKPDVFKDMNADDILKALSTVMKPEDLNNYFKAELLKLKKEELGLKGGELELKKEKEMKKPPVLTKGQEAVDRDFAKDYNDFVTAGGYADVQKSVSQLKGVSEDLGKTDTASGGMIGMMPKFARDIVVPKGAALQDTVEEIVQRNLKLVLGGQFTQREGELLMERTFNPRQSEKENRRRVDRLVKQIDEAAKAKSEAGAYYEEHGTLAGFKGKLYRSANDFLSDEKPGGKSAPRPLGVNAMTDDDLIAQARGK